MRVLLSSARIRQRVRELAREMARYYRKEHPGERPVLLALMNGALFFTADLLRTPEMTALEPELLCLRVASYAGKRSTGKITGLAALKELRPKLKGRPVLIVDDILDTGLTLAALEKKLRPWRVEAKICVLLAKDRPHQTTADWIGFTIGDEFVVGYGLDYEGRYRGLGEIRVMG